jgi:ABC-type phosphate transport system permease subunit
MSREAPVSFTAFPVIEATSDQANACRRFGAIKMLEALIAITVMAWSIAVPVPVGFG